MTSQEIDDLGYALAKQVPALERGFTISTSYGDIAICAADARAVACVVERILTRKLNEARLRTPIQCVIAAGRVEVHTSSEFAGWWRDGYWIRVAQDEDYTNDWYITVRHPDGGYLYDGWWTDSGHRTVDDAVAEAFRGAELLDDDAKQENQNA